MDQNDVTMAAMEQKMDALAEMAMNPPKPLTAENLEKASSKALSKAPSVASKKKKAPARPAWAQTADQAEE